MNREVIEACNRLIDTTSVNKCLELAYKSTKWSNISFFCLMIGILAIGWVGLYYISKD